MQSKLSLIKKVALATGASTIFLASPVFAQQSSNTSGVGTEVSSPIYEFSLKPGQVQQDIIKVKNVGSSVTTYYPQVLDFTSNDRDGAPVFVKEGEKSPTYSLSEWVSISTEPVTIEPNKSQAFNFNITVPENAEPGGHYAGILFSTQAPTSEDTNIGIASKVGSLILVSVAGDIKEQASIQEFKTDKPQYEEAKVNFSTTIKNTGNVHVQPKGVITVKNLIGGQVAAIDVNQLSANVLPGSSRIFESSWEDPGFKLGLYKATLTLTYGDPSQTISSSTSFWIIPWMTLLIALLVIAVVLAILIFAIKRYNNWIINKAKEQSN
jgi:hypothetical protein